MDRDKNNGIPNNEKVDGFESQRAVNEEEYNRGSWSDVMNGGSSVEYRTPVTPKKKIRKKMPTWGKVWLGIFVAAFLLIGISSIFNNVPAEEQMTIDRAGFDDGENKKLNYQGYRLSIPLYYKEITEDAEDMLQFKADSDDIVRLAMWVYEVEKDLVDTSKYKYQDEKEIAMLDAISNAQKDTISNIESWSDLRCQNIEVKKVDGHEAFIMRYTMTYDLTRYYGTFFFIANAENNEVLTISFRQTTNTKINYWKDAKKISESVEF